ncbi:hypothetical protein Prudu_014710 [Prunus dulcis]|uniref:Uncharacterized protein n=1 Tax=Prunus dulcis TaxID=3755 RepID=A0A4Y1RII2_PRUDU|nr:hypothetical protein Prudu_014710 [Prunus dulcis]
MFMHFGKVPNSDSFICRDGQGRDEDPRHCVLQQASNYCSKILFYDGHDIAFAPYGEYWRQVRRICVLELLSLKRVHQFQYARVEEVAELVSKIRKASASANGAPINLGELLVSTSNNIICRCILGQKFEDKEDNWFGETTKELMTQVMSFSFGDFFPSLKWIDRARGYLAYLKSIWLEFDKFFDKLIDEHKAAQKEGKPRKRILWIFSSTFKRMARLTLSSLPPMSKQFCRTCLWVEVILVGQQRFG